MGSGDRCGGKRIGAIVTFSIRGVQRQVTILASLVGVMWVIQCLNALSGYALDQFGILPRTLVGLRGILFAPFLHASFGHLFANTVPFVVLGWFVMLRRTEDFFGVSLVAMAVGGFGTWLIAPANTIHIGASGVIFGYLGFLISRGYFERNAVSILLSLAVGFVYGGLIWGVFPGQQGISWQGHLFGLVGGVLAGKLLSRKVLPH
jgi:membrane associated rhomboid family serine protease